MKKFEKTGKLKKEKKKKSDHSLLFPNSEREDSDSSNSPEKKKRFLTTARNILVGIFVLITLFNTVYFLQEDEYGVIRTLGSTSIIETPGIKFKIPYFQHIIKVSKAAKQFSIGYSLDSEESVYGESFMITKDYNFVNVDFYFEYQITDPVKYLYASEQPELVVKNLAQSYIRDTVGSCKVDDVLTTGKYEIQTTVRNKLQERLSKEDIGIQITNAVIQDAEVPTEEVKQAFKNVEDAKQGMDTAINNANADANTRIPKAEADADKIIKDAQAKKESLIAEAEGQTARFNSLYGEYVKFPLITKQRMFYETMEDILPGMKVYITDGKTQTLLPLEPFASLELPEQPVNDTSTKTPDSEKDTPEEEDTYDEDE
ncbi:MAG: FtsH protease activity modulator HflK [Lachnospiraceae bacterium]|nr:FtsH protease activity modulator HflK [Lachnospiraceae bacterium]